MQPQELRSFAAEHLGPRLPWLMRRDLSWGEPSDRDFVCPTEFVLTPVGPIKCDFTMTAVPVDQGRGSVVNVGFGFLPLYLPFTFALSVALRRRRSFSTRWPLRSGAGEEMAIEMARAIESQWARQAKAGGTVEGLIRGLRYDAGDRKMLEVLAYSHVLAGDHEGALGAIRRVVTLDLVEADRARIGRMEALIQSDAQAAVDQLGAWRLERLADLGLLDVAAPWSPPYHGW